MDLLVTGARVAAGPWEAAGLRDVAIRDGRILAVEPPDTIPLESTARHIAAAGALLAPSLVDPHVHLDVCLTAGTLDTNRSGTLGEAISLLAAFRPALTREDVIARARHAIRWEVAQGVSHIRTHVDICEERLIALDALLDLKDELRGVVDLQIVAFPQDGLLSHPGTLDRLRRALDKGADVVGAIPHFETSREAGIESLDLAFREADRRGLLIDAHCDETDDPTSRFAETMARLTLDFGMQGRVTASHCTAMHGYDDAYAESLYHLFAEARLNIVTNPFDNLLLQGRGETYPKRRGLTRVKELLAHGVNVAAGNDSIMDVICPLGRGDMLDAANLVLLACQMSGEDEVDACFDMVSWRAAQSLGLVDVGIAPSMRADLVLFDAPSKREALRRGAARRAVIKHGAVIAETTPARSVLLGRDVDFRPPVAGGA